jgi:hypothetical protein
MPREEGYYCVKRGIHWRVGYWSGKDDIYPGHWALIGTQIPFFDEDFKEINEEKLQVPPK